jgi:4-aminobutyrate aminotransferase
LVAVAEGAYMYDNKGEKYLDFTCGIGVTNLGHNHPRLIKAVRKQSEKLFHGMVACGIHTAAAELIDELDTVVPSYLDNFFFCSTGSEAVEGALRCARTVTGGKRQSVVVLQGSYHGRTNACLALTTSKYAYGIGCKPTMPGVTVAPPPYTTQLKVPALGSESSEDMSAKCLAIMEDLLVQTQAPSEVAMILLEPVLGEGGYLPLPACYLKGLRALCDKYGILLAFDEVQTGFGRTGSMFTCEQVDVKPDILIFAKGIANGLPLAGFASSKALGDQCIVGTQGGTYAGNAVACASAAEVIRIFRDEKILDNVVEQGQYLWGKVEDMCLRNPSFPIQEVRGRGLMIGVQFRDLWTEGCGTVAAASSNTESAVPAGFAAEVVGCALKKNLMLLNTSKFETLRLIPPLNVTPAQIDSAVAVLEASIKEAMINKKVDASATATKEFRDCCPTPCYKLDGWSLPCRRILVTKKNKGASTT